MSFLNNKSFFFFNSKGEDLNFIKKNGIYKGSIFLPKISTFLISNLNVFIYEEFELNSNSEILLGLPQNNPSNQTKFFFEFEDKDDLNWNFYNFEENNLIKNLIYKNNQINDLDQENLIIGNSNNRSLANSVNSNSIKTNIAFSSEEEGSFRNILNLYAISDNSKELILQIDLYIEIEEEDERLGTVINNFYKDVEVDQQDFFIFKNTNIKEGYPDWNIINSKLKELLLNGRYLKNYQGSYRGLLTAIKYFGYESLRIKEYFKNVDESSKDFGKNKLKEINDQFDGILDPFYLDTEPLPNKIWKKTADFGLFYDLNKVIENQFDEFGLPEVEDAFDFSNEEILIKLQGLKEKLKSKFLPLSSKIISITGEGNYFTKYDINSWSDYHISNKINVGREASFKINPNDCGFIINLNELLIELNSILKQDNELVIDESEVRFYNTNLNNIIPLIHNAIKIKSISINDNTFFINGVDYILNGNGDSIIWISSEFNLNNNDKIIINYTYSALNTQLNNLYTETLRYNQLKNEIVNKNIILDSKYSQTFINHIRNENISINDISDDEDTPVGAPLNLKNTTFSLNWDEINISWEMANEGINGNLNTWDNIKFQSFYEIEWIIDKQISLESPSEWKYELRGDINTYEEINLILPYSGIYDITMRLHNTFNSSTSQNHQIEIEQKNPDVVVNYKAFRTDTNWNSINGNWENIQYTWAVNLLDNLSWNDANISFNSIDKAKYSNERLYNSLFNFTLDNISNARWEQLDHLWWDGTSDAVLYNPYTWETWGNKTWNSFYKNETWDGNTIASDSAAFFEISEINLNAEITIGNREPATFTKTTIDPILGQVEETLPLFYNFIRINSNSNYNINEGNLIQINDSIGNVLLNITRDSNNKITHLNGNILERANIINFIKNYDGNNILLNEPQLEEIIFLKLNDITLEENVDFTVINQNNIQFTNSININDKIEIKYYSQQIKEINQEETEIFDNINNNTLINIDSIFFNNLIVGDEILLINSNNNSFLYRTITNINNTNYSIEYNGSNRSNITKIINPNITKMEILSRNNFELKEKSWKLINLELSKFNADLNSSEIKRRVFNVFGDTLLFSSTAVNLENAWLELTNSDLSEFNKFNWNIIYEADGITPNRIQAVSKLFGENNSKWIDYKNAIGDIFAPALTLNYNWNELRVFETRKEIPQFTQIIFSFDNSTMPGKQHIAHWELIENESGEIYSLNQNVFTHFFNRRGEYILKLVIEDSNSNKKECIKQGIVLVK